jgi:hypothetical protein
MTQFVAIRYAPGDRRSYTFRNDGELVAAGTFVEVTLRNGDPKVVEVVSVTDEAPPFECKPMLRQAERPDSWPISDTLPLEGN